MSIELVKKYGPQVDELFKAESKFRLVTNTDYDWTGAHAIKVYKISTVALNDYARNVHSTDLNPPDSISRYGDLYDLDAATEELLLSNDKSFIFNIDKLDMDETAGALQAASALAREVREVVIPTIDTYVFGEMVDNAGTVADTVSLEGLDVYEAILDGTETLDDYEVPETGRVIVISPAVYKSLKADNVFDHSDIGTEARLRGVVGTIDGMAVVRVPSSRLPQGFGFMICHPSATVAPVKLDDYGVHHDTVLSSGDIVTGRICYDAFVLDNKAKGIYYQPVGPTGATGATGATS